CARDGNYEDYAVDYW
nr:immunoglobulin heavy chain junction region [Mus musculus]